MRFKKLRAAVGISIAIFILVIGIIMITGLSNNPSSQNSANVIAPASNKEISASSGSAPSNQNQQVQQEQPSPVIIRHPMLMTGAS